LTIHKRRRKARRMIGRTTEAGVRTRTVVSLYTDGNLDGKLDGKPDRSPKRWGRRVQSKKMDGYVVWCVAADRVENG
jgi:hypothetical protein